ncbi:MAG: TolC family protein [Elusimicrobiota bacterium]
MIHLFTLILLLPVILPDGVAQIAPVERVFNVEQSIFYALRNRKDILLVSKDLEIARERIKEAGSFKYPKIDLTFNYSDVSTDRFTSLPPAFGSILIPRRTPGPYYTTRLSLWQNVYAGGLYSSNIQFAKSNIIRAENQVKVVTNDVVFAVKKSFYELIATRELIALYEIFISSAQGIIKSGTFKSIDEELQADTLLAEINDKYNRMKTNFEKQKLDFLNTLGLELDTNFKIEGSFDSEIESYDINKLLAWAFEYRPEPKQIQAQEEIDALSMKLSLSARYPTVALGAHYEFPGEKFAFDNKNWNATISLNLPIFDGWASWSRIRQKRLQLEQNKLKKKELEDSIRLEVRKSYSEYNYLLDDLKEKQQRTQKAEEFTLKLQQASVLEGLKILRYWLNAKTEYVTALKEYNKAKAAVEHAVGKTLVKE